jgi:hypothetical protein
MSKERLTVTVDPLLVRAGADAVSAGRADSLSAWVNQALAERAAKDRRLRAMAAAIGAYEAEFGVMTDDELAAQARDDRLAGRVVRGVPRRTRPPRRRRRGVA